MAESKQEHIGNCSLFQEEEIGEILELKKFIDPEFNLSPLKEITDLFDNLNHLLK